jgi:hypothetical protein
VAPYIPLAPAQSPVPNDVACIERLSKQEPTTFPARMFGMMFGMMFGTVKGRVGCGFSVATLALSRGCCHERSVC